MTQNRIGVREARLIDAALCALWRTPLIHELPGSLNYQDGVHTRAGPRLRYHDYSFIINLKT